MIEAGIFDGDTAVIQSSQSAENGEIVVALG
jgi:SOS-response transcriptional repressor LexA